MKKATCLALIALFLVACGGGPSAHARGPDEVTATWTAGDDAPLEEADDD